MLENSEIRFFGEYSFDKLPMRVMRGIEIVDLPHRQLEVLSVLLEADGNVVSREAIIDSVWSDVIVEEHSLTQMIFLLRRSLGKLPNGQEYIETVPRKGYRINAAALKANASPLPHVTVRPNGDKALTFGGVSSDRVVPVPEPRRQALSLLWIGLVVLVALGAWKASTSQRFSSRPLLIAVQRMTWGGGQKGNETPLLVRDATLLFSERWNNEEQITSIPFSGGKSTSWPLASGSGLATSVHPETGELLLSHPIADGLIMRASPSGDTSQPFGYLHGHSAVWSPNGKSVAYGLEHHLLVADSSGHSRSLAGGLSGRAFWLAWAPDGQSVRFSIRQDGGRQTIQEVNIKTGVITPVMSGDLNAHHACCGTWSSDGSYFVYLVKDGMTSSIWVRREGWRGSILRGGPWKVAAASVDSWWSPIMSADRRHIYAIGEQRRNHLLFLKEGFAPFMSEVSIDSMSISHDGQWIAYTTYPEGALWKCRLDGSQRVQLSAPKGRVRSPQWSSDDSTLMYLRAEDGDAWIIASTEARAGGPERYLDLGNDIGTFSYTPAGDRTAFDAIDPSLNASVGISIVSLGGRRVEQIPMSTNLSNVKWSPDGRYLAALATNHRKIMLFDTHLQEWITVAAASEVQAPAWDRKQNLLYFLADDENRRAVKKYIVASHSLVDVTQVPERYKHGHASKVLESMPDGGLLFGYSEGAMELYDLTVQLP